MRAVLDAAITKTVPRTKVRKAVEDADVVITNWETGDPVEFFDSQIGGTLLAAAGFETDASGRVTHEDLAPGGDLCAETQNLRIVGTDAAGQTHEMFWPLMSARDMGGRIIKRGRSTSAFTTSSTATNPPAVFNEGTVSIPDVEVAADEEIEIEVSGSNFRNNGANLSVVYIVRVVAGVATIIGTADMQGTNRVPLNRKVVDEPGAGTYTYELRGAVGAGTMSVSATGNNPLELIVRAA